MDLEVYVISRGLSSATRSFPLPFTTLSSQAAEPQLMGTLNSEQNWQGQSSGEVSPVVRSSKKKKKKTSRRSEN